MNAKDKTKQSISEKEMKAIKEKIVKIHKSNKNEVPEFLDNLKKQFNLKYKEATSDNEFLKYM